jgi:putative phosphonate metabolism protein
MTADAAGARYALYFAPAPDSALHRFGSSWLGRDATTDAAVERPAVAEFAPDRLAEITRSPARYGFHATLKAPFRLALGCDKAALADAVMALTATRRPFATPPLALATIDGWRALVLSEPCAQMQALCDEMVAGLEPLRATPSQAEVARRLGAGLSERQQALFRRWGYPYVFDEFRFHMTLTSPLDAGEGARIDAALAPLVAPFAVPHPVDGVALFHQPGAAMPFTMVARFGFAADARNPAAQTG